MSDSKKQNAGDLTQDRDEPELNTQSRSSSSSHQQPAGFAKSKYLPPHLRNRPEISSPSQSRSKPSQSPAVEDGHESVPSAHDRRPPAFAERDFGYSNGRPTRASSYSSFERPRRQDSWDVPQPHQHHHGHLQDYKGGGGWSRDSSPALGHRRDDRSSRSRRIIDEPNPFETDGDQLGEAKNSKIDFDKYDEIPVETSGRECPKPIDAWTDIDLGPTLANNIKLARYDRPTPVQKYSLPIVCGGRDLMGCAQTGSGKTAAFLFPMISQLVQTEPVNEGNGFAGYGRKAYPLALVLAPTRELACQIYDEAKKFSWKTGLKSVVVYGGAPMGYQLRDLERGCDILVATPGRLVDIIERARVSLAHIKYVVLDEADRMLDMGFEPQIRRIVEGEDMPRTGDRQTLMFSATFPKEIQRLAASFLYDYIFLAVGRVGSTTDLVTQKFIRVSEDDKMPMLLDLLGTVKGLTIIFVETKRKADLLEDFLIRQGFPATSIHGDRAQQDREQALRSFSSGDTPFLIATNVAARGLDIENITHVINFDMPTDIDDYVHRIGRTGRAGKPGLATAFISEENVNIVPKLLEILQESRQDIPEWLEGLRAGRHYSHHGGGYRGGRGGGGSRFGGRDYRNERVDRTRDERGASTSSSNRGGSDSWGGSPSWGSSGAGGNYQSTSSKQADWW